MRINQFLARAPVPSTVIMLRLSIVVCIILLHLLLEQLCQYLNLALSIVRPKTSHPDVEMRPPAVASTSLRTCFYEATGETELKFHEYRGENIDLFDNRTVAFRRISFANSIVFSDRPLSPEQLFLVEIDRNENGWSGHMRLGLTRVNPEHRYPLPFYALPDLNLLGQSWIFAITRRKNLFYDGVNGELALPVRPPLVSAFGDGPCNCCAAVTHKSTMETLPTDVGSRIGVYYKLVDGGRVAQMHLVVNGQDQGASVEIENGDGPLYAVVDVYGTTKQVKIVPLVRTVRPLQELCRQSIVNMTNGLEYLQLLPLPDRLKHYLQHAAHCRAHLKNEE